MSFCVCVSVCACACSLGLSPERFCSVPLQGDAGYHGSNIGSLNLSLFLFLPLSFSLIPSPSFSLFLSFTLPSLFLFSLFLLPSSSTSVSRPPAFIYMTQLVHGQAFFISGREIQYMEIMAMLHSYHYNAFLQFLQKYTGTFPYHQSSPYFFVVLTLWGSYSSGPSCLGASSDTRFSMQHQTENY